MLAAQVLHERAEKHLITTLEMDFFGKTKPLDCVSLLCFKVVIKALCKSG